MAMFLTNPPPNKSLDASRGNVFLKTLCKSKFGATPRPRQLHRYAVSLMIVKCNSCGKENEFAQPYPYHAGFGNQGFLYNDAGNLTLVWSLYDSDYEALVGGKDALHLTDEDRATIESSLLPARFGGRFRFANPARCKQCRSEISGPMLRTVSYLVYEGSLVTDAGADAMGFKFALAGTA